MVIVRDAEEDALRFGQHQPFVPPRLDVELREAIPQIEAAQGRRSAAAEHPAEEHSEKGRNQAGGAERAAGAADRSDYESEYRLIAADGREVWVRDIVRVTGDGKYLQGKPLSLRPNSDNVYDVVVAQSIDGGATWTEQKVYDEAGEEVTTPDGYADPNGRMADYGGKKYGLTGDTGDWQHHYVDLTPWAGCVTTSGLLPAANGRGSDPNARPLPATRPGLEITPRRASG